MRGSGSFNTADLAEKFSQFQGGEPFGGFQFHGGGRQQYDFF